MSTTIPEDAMDHASVAPASPDDKPATDPRQDAGQDTTIAERLEADPEDVDARLDAGLDEVDGRLRSPIGDPASAQSRSAGIVGL